MKITNLSLAAIAEMLPKIDVHSRQDLQGSWVTTGVMDGEQHALVQDTVTGDGVLITFEDGVALI